MGSRKVNNLWTAPVSVANGIQNDTLRYPTWNRFIPGAGGELLLFYKWLDLPLEGMDENICRWRFNMSAAKACLLLYWPVKNKPLLVGNKKLLAPSSTEGEGWKLHLECLGFWKNLAHDRTISDGKRSMLSTKYTDI